MILQDISIGALTLALIALFFLSAFFSGSETALMSVNRYRLTHLARKKHKGARRVMRLLEKPDRLIGLILFGNNLVNIIIAQIATLIGYRLYGDAGIAAATGVLTFLMLVFAELAPKTLGALHPQTVVMPVALIYTPLMKLLYPLVWFINLFSNALLNTLGVSRATETVNPLSREELRTLLTSAGRRITPQYQDMLLGILDLEKKTVEDIMIPRNEIVGINIELGLEEIEELLRHTNFTRIPLHRGDVNEITGVLHVRDLLAMIQEGEVTRESLVKAARAPSYVPENLSLLNALAEFKAGRRRLALVVDEYGDVQGLITLEDLLEEIVGEFTSDPSTYDLEIERRDDGSVVVDGACHVRELNRALGWNLNENGPKTINGLVVERLESIPERGTCILIDGHPLEVIKTRRNAVKAVKIGPRLNPPPDGAEA